jgi:hypothetical protein
MTSTQECAVRFFRPGKVLLGLAGWFVVGNLSLSAAPITTSGHKHHPVSDQIHEFQAYLEGGPGHWATSQLMQVPDGVHVRYKDGQLKNNLAVDYVMWVRDQHPKHFDHNHPTLGKQLEAAQDDWGTQFFVFPTKHHKGAQAESIHAMTTTSSTGTSTSTSPTTSSSSPSVQARVVDPPSPAQGSGSATPRSAIVSSSGAQLFPAISAATAHSPQVALETLAPPMTPAISVLPPPSAFNPPITQEISSSSVVTTNHQVIAEQLSAPSAVPEPSSALLAFLLFGAAAGWKGLRSKGLRWSCRIAG